MQIPILATKFHTPTFTTKFISRPRLIEQINAGVNCKLTLISAPAGFGKSTLLGEYVTKSNIEVAWISLDRGDNDPIRFLIYFINAIKIIKPHFGEEILDTLQSQQNTKQEFLLSEIINQIVLNIPGPFVMVMDDYHFITDPEIQKMLSFLVENQPQQMHLVISTRSDPPWPLARLRVRGEMNEIRAQDLRFRNQEISQFLIEMMCLNLKSDEIRLLEARTEGWIAGLQMAAISMQSQENITGFIQSFTGSHRFILDFLVEEVLDQQPLGLREFLLKTSILKRLAGDLCNFVLNIENSQSILLEIEHLNLFLIPLDDQRIWYRYHHLFADLLLHRLKQDHPDVEKQLNLRASTWFSNHGFISDAIEHALACKDYDAAAEIVEQNVVALKDHGELSVVLRWLDEFPEHRLHSRPWLCIAKAWALAYIGNSNETKILLEKAENTLSNNPSDIGHIQGHISAISCYLKLFDGEFAGCIEDGYQALRYLPETDIQTRISVTTTLASALRVTGEIKTAYNLLLDIIEISQKSAATQTSVRLKCALAITQVDLGYLQDAIETLESAIAIATRVGIDGRIKVMPVAGHAYVRLGLVLYSMNKLDSALQHVKLGVDLCNRWGQANSIWESHMILTLILKAVGNNDEYQKALTETETIANKISSKYIMDGTAALMAELWLDEGNLDAVLDWVEKSGFKKNDNFQLHEVELYKTYVLVLLKQGKVQDALIVLGKMLEISERFNIVEHIIKTYILEALAYHMLGDEDRAINFLERAIRLGHSSGHIRNFIDLCEPIVHLLKKLVSQGIALEFTNQIIREIQNQQTRNSAATQPIGTLIDALSEREQQVLQLLVTDMKTPEIANELIISVSTVRSHIKSIYSKLGAHSRYEAITKAQALKLI